MSVGPGPQPVNVPSGPTFDRSLDMVEGNPTWAKVVAFVLVLLGIAGSLALTGAFIWALIEVVSWLVTK